MRYATRKFNTLLLAGLCAAFLASISRGAPTGGEASDSASGDIPRTGASSPGPFGRALVIDGDTIVIGETRIRLEGIDAPEGSQRCGRASLGTWNCGEAATQFLASLIKDRDVRCAARGHDAYGRVLGVCYAGPVELNAEMVRQGLAWAFVKYSRTYVATEADARSARVGVWQGTAEPPWEYRRGKWRVAEAGAPEGCAIKGNVSSHGRVYHTPWSPWYEKAHIDVAKGERWFCSEGDAISAGWRPAFIR